MSARPVSTPWMGAPDPPPAFEYRGITVLPQQESSALAVVRGRHQHQRDRARAREVCRPTRPAEGSGVGPGWHHRSPSLIPGFPSFSDESRKRYKNQRLAATAHGPRPRGIAGIDTRGSGRQGSSAASPRVAPCFSSNSTVAAFFLGSAQSRGVRPRSLLELTLAPLAISNSATSLKPCEQAT